MNEKKVALSGLVGQAWQQLQGMVVEEVKKKVEELAEAERESRLGRARHGRGGNALRRWGYKVRKFLLTPWGLIAGLRRPLQHRRSRRQVRFPRRQCPHVRHWPILIPHRLPRGRFEAP